MSILDTTASRLKMGAKNLAGAISKEVTGYLPGTGNSAELAEDIVQDDLGDDAYGNLPRSGGGGRVANLLKDKASAALGAIPQLRAAQLLYQNRKWVSYVLIGVGFFVISGFMNITENIKNNPIGFVADNGWCLYVEGKSALECMGCEDLSGKYGADPASFGCNQIVEASKGNQIVQ